MADTHAKSKAAALGQQAVMSVGAIVARATGRAAAAIAGL